MSEFITDTKTLDEDELYFAFIGGTAGALDALLSSGESSKSVSLKYSEDQPRDEMGRFAETDGGGTAPIKLSHKITPSNSDELLWNPAMREIDARTAIAGYKSDYASMWREDYYGEAASAVKEYVTRDITKNMDDVSTQDLVSVTGIDDIADVAIALQEVPDDYKWGGPNDTGDEDFQLIGPNGGGGVRAIWASDVLDLSDLTKDGWTKEDVVTRLEEFNKTQSGEVFWELQGTPGAEKIVREAATARLVSQWAETSNNGHAVSLAMQEVAAKEFGIENHAPWEMNEETRALVDKYTAEGEKVYSSFLRAQYDATQNYLADRGVESITVFRGMRDLPAATVAEATSAKNVDMSFRPLTSFSLNDEVAAGFAGGADRGNASDDALILKAQIPVEKILSIPVTGIGCLLEEEAVILGGALNVSAVLPQKYIDNIEADKDGWA